jgi:hypothetical protein
LSFSTKASAEKAATEGGQGNERGVKRERNQETVEVEEAQNGQHGFSNQFG